jgi:outer membrane protein TolC
VIVYGSDLKSLLNFALSNNKIIQSKLLTQSAKLKDVESSKNTYYPTVDVGGFYQNLNGRTPGVAGDIYSTYAKVGVDLYDGGIKKNNIEQKKALLNSSKYDTASYKKSLQLDIVNDFFNIQSAKQTLKALANKKIQLQAELARIKKFYEVGSATKDEVDKLQAALSNSVYQINSVKFQILSLKQILSIKIGKRVGNLKKSIIMEPKNIQKNVSDDIKTLIENSKSLEFSAKSLNSIYKPQVRLEDTFSLYGYGRSDSTHFKGVDNQNKFMLSFNIKIFDNDVVKKQKESLMIQKMAIDTQIAEQKDVQNINVKLAKSKIQTIKAQIASAKSSLISASSAYQAISQKFKAGVLDNVAYLDALSVKTNAKAQYETALNDLQIAYASYYFYSNENIKDYIK